MAQQRYEITAGPSKFDISVALFHCLGSRQRHIVRFTVRNETTARLDVEAEVTGVELEDCSHENWVISGWVNDESEFTAHFNTQRRLGVMTIG